MTDDNLKYKKRNWNKLIAKVYLIQKRDNCGFYDIVLYKGNNKIHFTIFNELIYTQIKLLRPNDKVVVWFSAKSNLYKDKWYTNLIIQHYESPNEIYKKKYKEQESINLGKINFNEEDFES